MSTPPQHSHQSGPPRRRALMLAAVIAVVALMAAGCTSDTEGEQPGLAQQTEPETGLPAAGEAQPQPGAGSGTLTAAEFADVPLPTGAQPLDDPTLENGVTVQNFTVTATNPQQVIEDYRGEMPALGWDEGVTDSEGIPTESVEQVQSTWTRDGQTLLITAADLDGQDTQLSLQLSGQG